MQNQKRRPLVDIDRLDNTDLSWMRVSQSIMRAMLFGLVWACVFGVAIPLIRETPVVALVAIALSAPVIIIAAMCVVLAGFAAVMPLIRSNTPKALLPVIVVAMPFLRLKRTPSVHDEPAPIQQSTRIEYEKAEQKRLAELRDDD